MRREFVARGYADGVAYVGTAGAVGVCPSCESSGVFVYLSHELCGACVSSSLEYSRRHGILADGLANDYADGRVLSAERIVRAVEFGFCRGVSDALAGTATRAAVTAAAYASPIVAESFSCGVCGSHLGQVAACDVCGAA